MSKLNTVTDFVKSRDIYGHPITLNYQGDDTYKTFIGGCISLALLAFVAAYAFLKGKYMVDMEEW